MISAKSIQRLYHPLQLQQLHAVRKLHSLRNKSEISKDAADDQHLSREQVIEIYDWIAQLHAR